MVNISVSKGNNLIVIFGPIWQRRVTGIPSDNGDSVAEQNSLRRSGDADR